MNQVTDSLMLQTRRIVEQAGQIIRDGFETSFQVRRKGPIDLVTSVDLAVERQLKDRLGELLPGASFLAEETASGNDLTELTWIVDPLDGTTNFAHGFPFVAISVALWQEGRVNLGIVHLPILKETFWAMRGQGAYSDDRTIRVAERKELEEALVATGFPYDVASRLDAVVCPMRRVLAACQGIRRAGSAAIDLAYIACGRMDAFYEIGLKPWDTAAGWLLVEEAGGRVSQFDPVREYALGSGSILAANPGLHGKMAQLLEGA